MHKIGRAVLGIAAIGAALTISAGTANASITEALTVSSPQNNTIVFTFANTGDYSTRCNAYGSGFTNFDTGDVKIAPRSSVTVTVVDVPAGNYDIGWDCRSFGHEHHFVSVVGSARPSAKPHVVPQGAAPLTSPADLSGLLALLGDLSES